jgi:hypothetical protein
VSHPLNPVVPAAGPRSDDEGKVTYEPPHLTGAESDGAVATRRLTVSRPRQFAPGTGLFPPALGTPEVCGWLPVTFFADGEAESRAPARPREVGEGLID